MSWAAEAPRAVMSAIYGDAAFSGGQVMPFIAPVADHQPQLKCWLKIIHMSTFRPSSLYLAQAY